MNQLSKETGKVVRDEHITMVLLLCFQEAKKWELKMLYRKFGMYVALAFFTAVIFFGFARIRTTGELDFKV